MIEVAVLLSLASDFSDRRADLEAHLKGKNLVVLGLSEEEGDTRDGFFQEPNFYYLTGLKDPGGAVIFKDGTATIYLDRRDEKKERWTGKKLAFEDRPDLGSQLKPADKLEGDLKELTGKLFVLTHSREKMRRLAPKAQLEEAEPFLARMRNVKSASELAIMQKAIDASIAAHRESWRTARPGLYEYQLASAMSGVYFAMGCQRNAYPPIVGSGPNGTVLHYFRNNRRMDAGELVLMDVGAECDGYAGDITRTIPVNGKFTARQRELYDAVLAAENAVIAAAKPGMTPNQLKQIAVDSLNKHKEKLGKYLIHGVSHQVGLEVHDAYVKDDPFPAGSVVTVEPGVYIPEEGIGIRIEDMILLTKDGARNLTASLPREAEDIEREMAKPRQDSSALRH